jgi:hypothetical protein
MEHSDNNVLSQSVMKEQVNYSLIEKQLIDANKEIEDLQSKIQWLERSYE